MADAASSVGAVFLSYASQDATAAERIGEALRAEGVPVWFDKNELRGGDAWDAQIKKRILDCALFIPVISAHTNARKEGYFRGEWNLAVRRLINMAQDAPFLVPVVVDETREAEARVPEEFLQAQWTWLPGGQTPPAFAQRVRQLLEGEAPSLRGLPAPRVTMRPIATRKHRAGVVGGAVAALLLLLAGGAWWYYQGRRPGPEAAAADFAPPPHSIAVLAFANMSGDPEDEYFSDGLSEELLNMLVRIERLQVAARTSSFSFKGTSVDIPTVGRRLNVGAVLEGSVRKADERVRITAKLISTVTGFNLWSQSFDRDLKDILGLQTEIATAVAGALEVVLLGDEKNRLEVGGTGNPDAFDAYLRAGKAYERDFTEPSLRAAIALYDEAIDKDPEFALAYAWRGDIFATLATMWSGSDEAERDALVEQAQASVRRAVELAPTSGQAYGKLAIVLTMTGTDYPAIDAAYRRALAIEPGNVAVLLEYARFAAGLGRPEALDAANRAVQLDPLKAGAHASKGIVLFFLRRYGEAAQSLGQALQSNDDSFFRTWLGTVEVANGRPAEAVRYCEPHRASWDGQSCLALAYHQLGRTREAQALLDQMMSENGDALAFQYAQVYAQWGQHDEALNWLEKAASARDPGLVDIRADPFLDPLRDMPRFRHVVEGLRLPN